MFLTNIWVCLAICAEVEPSAKVKLPGKKTSVSTEPRGLSLGTVSARMPSLLLSKSRRKPPGNRPGLGSGSTEYARHLNSQSPEASCSPQEREEKEGDWQGLGEQLTTVALF